MTGTSQIDILIHHDSFHLKKTTKRILKFSIGLQFRNGYYEGKKDMWMTEGTNDW